MSYPARAEGLGKYDKTEYLHDDQKTGDFMNEMEALCGQQCEKQLSTKPLKEIKEHGIIFHFYHFFFFSYYFVFQGSPVEWQADNHDCTLAMVLSNMKLIT